jgi:hypothetical protein
LNAWHLPFPKWIYIAFHHLHIFLFNNHKPAYFEKSLIEIFRIKVSHVFFKQVIFNCLGRSLPCSQIFSQSFNIVIEYLSSRSYLSLVIYFRSLINHKVIFENNFSII